MPRLITEGIDSLFPLADMLRLFYGTVREDGPGCLTAGQPEPVIYSSCRPESDGHFLILTTADDFALQNRVDAADSRRESKRQLYLILRHITGISWPWGSLTGVRPTLVAERCLQTEKTPDKARSKLIDYWLVSPPRADLALQTARAERDLLRRVPDTDICVYISIPFCPGRCTYCSFISQENGGHYSLLKDYVSSLIREVQIIFQDQEQHISCLYIGGGTPTSLDESQLEILFAGLREVLDFSLIGEITVEAGRPDTISAGKMEVLREAGVDRICINPQTFHDQTLELIGRRHNTEDTLRAMRIARNYEFAAVNMDLIAGLPGESESDFYQSVRRTMDLQPENITIHSLAFKRGAFLRDSATREDFSLRPEPELAAMLLQVYAELAENGYNPYYLYRQKNCIGGLENIGFSRPGKECQYNVAMMSDRRSVLGIGAGAMSKWKFPDKVHRKANPRQVNLYQEKVCQLAEEKRGLLTKFTCRYPAPD